MSSGSTLSPLSLRCALICAHTSLGDLLAGALLRRLAVQDPGRVPVGDVDREAVDRRAVAVVARRSRGCPRTGAWVSAVSAHGASTKVMWPRMSRRSALR